MITYCLYGDKGSEIITYSSENTVFFLKTCSLFNSSCSLILVKALMTSASMGIKKVKKKIEITLYQQQNHLSSTGTTKAEKQMGCSFS